MKIFGTRGMVSWIATIAVCFLMVTGCTKYASVEDLQELEKARNAAKSAEREVRDLKAEERAMGQEVQARQDSLQAIQDELETVKSCMVKQQQIQEVE